MQTLVLPGTWLTVMQNYQVEVIPKSKLVSIPMMTCVIRGTGVSGVHVAEHAKALDQDPKIVPARLESKRIVMDTLRLRLKLVALRLICVQTGYFQMNFLLVPKRAGPDQGPR